MVAGAVEATGEGAATEAHTLCAQPHVLKSLQQEL